MRGQITFAACLVILLSLSFIADAKVQHKLQRAKLVVRRGENDTASAETETAESETWGECSKTCGEGVQVSNQGHKRSCQERECIASWGSWGECSVTCGGGTRTRICENAGTAQCEGASSESCNEQACEENGQSKPLTDEVKADVAAAVVAPANCKSGTWIAMTSCSAECGEGSQKFKLFYEEGSDSTCPDNEKVEMCNNKPCPVHCEMSNWEAAGECSSPCGGTGKRRFVREVKQQPENGGRPCGTLLQYVECNTEPCPRDAEVSEWFECSPCSAKCGEGKQQFCRNVTHPSENGGRPPAPDKELRDCKLADCRQDCVEGEWEPEGPCSVSCGGGEQKFSRKPKVEPNEFGTGCGAQAETRRCNTHPCPIHCEYHEWVPQSPCNKSCGGGKRRFTRTVAVANSDNGEPCSNLEKFEDCNKFDCPIDCEQSDWQAKGACSAECGSGTQEFTRTTIHEPNEYGRTCSYHTEYRVCTGKPCAL